MVKTKKPEFVDFPGAEHFSGTENYYQHWTKRLKYTDGVHFLVENGAAWLIDVIASYQIPGGLRDAKGKKFISPGLEEFQFWMVEKCPKDAAIVRCYDDYPGEQIVLQTIEFTDLPIKAGQAIKLYVEGGVCLLPSEH